MLNTRRRKTAAQVILKLLSIVVLLSGIAETGIGLLLNFSTENAIRIVGEAVTYALADIWWLICISGVVSCLCGLAGMGAANDPYNTSTCTVMCVVALGLTAFVRRQAGTGILWEIMNGTFDLASLDPASVAMPLTFVAMLVLSVVISVQAKD